MGKSVGRSGGFGACALLIGAGMLSTSAGAQTCPSETASYRLEFQAVWSAATHPTEFPGNAHFSGLIGGSHSAAASFWAPGALASNGIESMAESGSKTALSNEVTAAIGAGTAEALISGGSIGISPGSVSHEFDLSQAYPLVSIVSMIAPSPDWFVGVADLNLFSDGAWVDELIVELVPWDAGTDDGPTYVSPNDNTNPAQPIAEIVGYPFLAGESVPPLGTFRFLRLDAACADADADGVDDAGDNCPQRYNPDQRDTEGDGIGNACDADIAPAPSGDCVVNFLDLGALKEAFLTTPGDAGWNEHADFDGDGNISFVDLGLVKEYFLQAPGPGAVPCE